ncbi:creatininase [Corynebacterium tapiri]|uniref:Creatininase n=1 Tax=Corynebacterium tapiri TaxID=1448266 RepID=A0A5C4U7Z8_9CORY|nr:creatininase [Corynebacterium tapiri]TNM00530.1 creatininase [Corynebacterium tapiri]
MVAAANLTWQEFADRVERVVILPVGSFEQHGPHLPLGTDSVIATKLAERVGKELDALVLPTLAYGYRSAPYSGGGSTFPGTLDLRLNTLTVLIQDILTELVADGCTKVLILNAHYENTAAIMEAMYLVGERFPSQVSLVTTAWWDCVDAEVLSDVFDDGPFPGWELEHAALTETSLMMHLDPESVHEDALPGDEGFHAPNYIRIPLKPGDIPAHGGLASARGASAAKGQRIADAAVDGVAQLCRKEWGLDVGH